MCNGILAGLVAITAPCDTVEPWAAIVIGLIGGVLYSFWSRLIVALNIDDPLEASGVHYINGVWGVLAPIIFDSQRGFVSGSPDMGKYLGVQVYGIICVTLWSIVFALLFFLPCQYFDVLKYHPVMELFGAHRFKSGEITDAFLNEARHFNTKKFDSENAVGPIIEGKDGDIRPASSNESDGKSPISLSGEVRKTAKVSHE